MLYNIIWSERAVKNLKSIEKYIAENSGNQSKIVVKEIINYVEKLCRLPYMGSIVQELNDNKFRQLIKYSYRIIYTIQNDQIQVITIIHSKQELLSTFKKH